MPASGGENSSRGPSSRVPEAPRIEIAALGKPVAVILGRPLEPVAPPRGGHRLPHTRPITAYRPRRLQRGPVRRSIGACLERSHTSLSPNGVPASAHSARSGNCRIRSPRTTISLPASPADVIRWHGAMRRCNNRCLIPGNAATPQAPPAAPRRPPVSRHRLGTAARSEQGNSRVLRTTALDYDLPASLIATHPVRPRDSARLMVVNGQDPAQAAQHRIVRDLPSLLRPGDLLVLNSSRVLPARIRGIRADTAGSWTACTSGPPRMPAAQFPAGACCSRRAGPRPGSS